MVSPRLADFDRLHGSVEEVAGRDATSASQSAVFYPAEEAGQSAWLAESRWRQIVRDFSPAWFTVVMGTGIVSLLPQTIPFPYEHLSDGQNAWVPEWLEVISIAIFLLNTVLFLIILSIFTLRFVLYPKSWSAMLHHPVQSVYLGTAPMAFSTIVSMCTYLMIFKYKWGGPSGWAEMFVWALWWVSAAASVLVALGVFWIMITSHRITLPGQTATMLLPIVTPIVISASGATVAKALSNPQHSIITLLACLTLWSIGVPTALLVLAMYFHRLMLYKLPPRDMIISVFLPLGPLGSGGYGAMIMGTVARSLVPHLHDLHPAAGDIFYVLGFFIAFVLWGFGLVWLFFALCSIGVSWKFPFNMGWWGLTFPLGVFAQSTLMMGYELPSITLKVIGTILAVAVTALWMLVFGLTAWHLWRRPMELLVTSGPAKPFEGESEKPGTGSSAEAENVRESEAPRLQLSL